MRRGILHITQELMGDGDGMVGKFLAFIEFVPVKVELNHSTNTYEMFGTSKYFADVPDGYQPVYNPRVCINKNGEITGVRMGA